MTVATLLWRQRRFSASNRRWHPVLFTVGAIILLVVGCTSVGTNGSADSDGEKDQHPGEGTEAPAGPPTTTAGSNGDDSEIASMYASDCAECHGDEGAGDGPIGAAFEMPDFTDGDYIEQLSDDELYEAIDQGTGEMPAFGDVYSEDEIDEMVDYIRTFAE